MGPGRGGGGGIGWLVGRAGLRLWSKPRELACMVEGTLNAKVLACLGETEWKAGWVGG